MKNLDPHGVYDVDRSFVELANAMQDDSLVYSNMLDYFRLDLSSLKQVVARHVDFVK